MLIRGGPMKIRNVMHSHTSVPVRMNVASASVTMDLKNIGSVLVEDDDGEILGIVTERDILRKVVARCKDPATTRVIDIMSSPVVMIDEHEHIESASTIMRDNNIRRLAVTSSGKISGMITTRSVANNLKFTIAKKLAEDKRF